MEKTFNETPKDFFAGWAIGDEIKETNNFLHKMFVLFIKMLGDIYKYIKKNVLKGFGFWPIYVSMFLISIFVSLFFKDPMKNILFIFYVGMLFLIFGVFLIIIRLIEALIKRMIDFVKSTINTGKYFQRKEYIDGVFEIFWLFILFVIIIIISTIIVFLCWFVKNGSVLINYMFTIIKSYSIKN